MARGTVVSFDDPAGYGEIEADDGRVLFFHCTAISGGTRTIDEGVTVTFDVVPGRLGRWEAEAITPVEG